MYRTCPTGGFWDVCEATDRPFVGDAQTIRGFCAATRAT